MPPLRPSAAATVPPSFLGVTAVQWQSASRMAIGVTLLASLSVAVAYAAEKRKFWCGRPSGRR